MPKAETTRTNRVQGETRQTPLSDGGHYTLICMMFMQLSCTFGCICWDLNDFIAPLPCDYDIQDSLSLLGDIVGSCVRPSAPEQDVWKVMIDKMIQLKKDTQEDN